MTIENKIEAILFYKTEPVAIEELARILKVPPTEIEKAVENLILNLADRGIRLIRQNYQVALGTAPEAKSLIEELTKEEFSKDLSRATLETLAIIIYRGEVARAEIDYVRGVNSSFTLRNLLIRGLIDKISNPKDSRGFLYRPSFDLLAHLGITNIEELPEFEAVQKEIKEFFNRSKDGNENQG